MISTFCSYFLLTSIFPIFEGMGQVEDVAKIRFLASIASYSCSFLVFIFGYGLYAPACIFGIASIVYILGYPQVGDRPLLTTLSPRRNAAKLSWLKIVFPCSGE